MEILTIIAFFLLFYLMTSKKIPVKSTTCEKLHKWVYKNEDTDIEYMVCEVCNKTPSQISSDDRSQV